MDRRTAIALGLVGLTTATAFPQRLLADTVVQGDGVLPSDPKEVVTVAILAVYAGYLWLGRTGSWRGARASALCVVNFILVLFSYSIVNLDLSSFHRFF